MGANSPLLCHECDDLLIEELTPGLAAVMAADLCVATFCRADSAWSAAPVFQRSVFA